ncbi:MAG: tripartite tricarboxylate transporter substrate binding protein [Rhizobiales bacterium]|nr:tripartite tricarboxylate transporter substrate binding protein [Hyphomicrobiales bacterium]
MTDVVRRNEFGGTMSRILGFVLAAACATFPFLAGSLSYAQTWPQQPITILVQTPPGTLLDAPARSLARELSEALGQNVTIENRVGGGGIVLLKAVAKAEPNGYLLGITAIGPAVIRPIMEKAVGFDFDRDFTPIVMLGDIPNTLLASPKLGVNSVQEFVAYAKAHPNVTMAHGGPGTIGHLAGILFGQSANIKLNFVGYRGSGPMITDLLSGEINSGFPPYNPAATNTKILAVATEKRFDILPDVPTMVESGYPNVVATTWTALVGPANLPPDIVGKLNKLINAWLNRPGQRSQFSKMGFVLTGGEPSGVMRQVQDDRRKWTAILHEHNITLDPQNK